MLLQATVNDLKDLPAELHENYAEVKDDSGNVTGYRLRQLEGYESPDSVAGLKSALKKEREKAAEHARELKTLKEQPNRADELRAQLAAQKLELAARDAIQTAQGNPALLLPQVKSRLRAVKDETTGEYTVQVLAKDGRTPQLDANGNPLTPEAFVTSLRTDANFAGAFRGTEHSGAGSGGVGSATPVHRGGPAPAAKTNRSQMTPKEKVAFIKTHGDDAYQSLPL